MGRRFKNPPLSESLGNFAVGEQEIYFRHLAEKARRLEAILEAAEALADAPAYAQLHKVVAVKEAVAEYRKKK